MRPLAVRALWLTALTAVLAPAGTPRYARVGEFSGNPEVEVHVSDDWRPALRNLPLVESSRIRSSSADRIEIECDDGGLLRLAGDGLAELSDYMQLSTGQRVMLISVDHGVVYFTGEPRVHDTISLAVPGAQITLREGSRVRLEAYEQSNAIAVLEGVIRFNTPQVEMDLHAGQFVKVDAGSAGRFTLLREIPKLASDEWSEARDKATAQSAAASYIANVGYGLTDLDHSGAWIQTEKSGTVWKPQTKDDWRPFRDGRWEWYDGAGYTWVAGETWGWLPYHYGRWLQDSDLGWVWSPDRRAAPIYKPGDVYWMRGTGRLAWGPLAPDETWTGMGRAELYAPFNTTLATFTAGQRVIEPSDIDSKVLSTMGFIVAPLSPALAGSRFEAQRPALQTDADAAPLVSSAPEVPNTAFEPESAPPAPEPPAPVPVPEAAPLIADNEDNSVPAETYYAAPVYTGIVVVDPPLRKASQTAQHGNSSGDTIAPPKHPVDRLPVEPPGTKPPADVKAKPSDHDSSNH